jgi:hypothetical protein
MLMRADTPEQPGERSQLQKQAQSREQRELIKAHERHPRNSQVKEPALQ